MALENVKKHKVLPEHIQWLGDSFKLSDAVGMTSEQLTLALPSLELLEIPKFSPIIKEHEKGDDLFVIYKGEVSVNKTKEYLGPVEIVRLGPGAFFGEIALLGRPERTATVSSEADCRIFRMAAAEVKALLVANPALAEHLKKIAEERLQKLSEASK